MMYVQQRNINNKLLDYYYGLIACHTRILFVEERVSLRIVI